MKFKELLQKGSSKTALLVLALAFLSYLPLLSQENSCAYESQGGHSTLTTGFQGQKDSTYMTRCKACLYKPKKARKSNSHYRQWYMGDNDFTYITPCEAQNGINVFIEPCFNGTPYEDAIPAALDEYNNAPIAINYIIVDDEALADLVIECDIGGNCCGCANAAFPDPDNPGDGPPNGQTFFPSGGSIGSGISLDLDWGFCPCTAPELNQCFFMHTVMHELAHTLGFYHNDQLGVDPIHVDGTPLGFDAGSIINSGPGEQAMGNFCTAGCVFNANDIIALQTLYPISPLLNNNNVFVDCTIESFDLQTIHEGNIPPNSNLVWSTDANPNDGVDPIIDPIVTESNTYYAYYNFATDDCFTEAAQVEVTFGYIPPPISSTSISNDCPEVSVDLNSIHTGSTPVNATLVWSTDGDPTNGVSPHISPNINESGTYFAYYYFEEEDCYSNPSNEIIVTIESCVCGEGNDIHIYTNTTYNSEMEVSGNIFVHSGAQLTVMSTLKFGKNKSIAVLQGGKLVVDGGHLTKCNETDDWQGIIVEGFSNQSQPDITSSPASGQAGIVWIKNNSLIEWARTAISTNYYDYGGSWTNQKWGGLVHCENSEFLNNRRVAEFMKYDLPNKSKFINCTMDGNSTISGTTVGVTIWDCDGITFNRCRFYNMEGQGLVSYDSGTIVKDGNDFHHNKRGISNRSTYPFSAYLEVGENGSNPNYFVDNWFHIESYASNKLSGLKIINNEFFNANTALWLIGPSKYFVENNSFSNSTGGVFSAHSGAMNNNQHNYVRYNGFNTSSGVTAYGKNRELQILCNDYQNTWDNRITQNNSGTEPGEIRLFQGSSSNAAGNCFTNPVNQGDINTIGNTTNFYYYHTTEALCKIPVTPGNYTAIPTPFGDCSQGEDPKDPPKGEDWTKVLEDIQEKEGNGDISSEEYYILLERKEEILLYLLDEHLSNGNIGDALAILSQDNTTFSQMAKYGILMNDGMYDEAEVELNSLSEEDTEMSEFKHIQAINIARLRSNGEYELSSTDESYLESISESDMGVKAYARSLLALLTGKEYTDELILEGGRFEFKSQPSTNLTEGFRIVPNPMNELFTISIDKEYFEMPVNIMISDINGRTIYTKTSEKNINVSINSENWQAGLYFLRVSNAGGEVIYTSKLVKQ